MPTAGDPFRGDVFCAKTTLTDVFKSVPLRFLFTKAIKKALLWCEPALRFTAGQPDQSCQSIATPMELSNAKSLLAVVRTVVAPKRVSGWSEDGGAALEAVSANMHKDV